MAPIAGRSRRHRDPLWFTVLMGLVVLPVACIIVAPCVIFRRSRYIVRRRRYVAFDGTEETMHRAAIANAPISYRWLGRSVPIDDLDAALAAMPEWQELRMKVETGDRIWPFTINPGTLAMRQGFVVVRRRKPIGLVVTVFS